MINTVIITLTNRQPAASLTHKNASMEIDRWVQCTSPPNTCLSWTYPSPNPKRHLDRLSRFCTAHGRASLYFTKNCLSPQIAPSHGSIWTPSNTWFLRPIHANKLNGIFIVQTFLYSSRQSVPAIYIGPPPSPLQLTFPWGSGTPSITWLFGPNRILSPNGISIRSAVFAAFTIETDGQTTVIGL